MRSILELFRRSPFGPLAEHTERCHETVVLLRPLFAAFTAAEWPKVQELCTEISRLEHDADELKNEIREHLPRSLFMPVDRGDILHFLKEQDSVADTAEQIALMLCMRETPTPEAMRQPVVDFVDHVIRTSELWYETARGLPLLQETSFAGPEVDRTLEAVRRIASLEWEAERQETRVLEELFRQEDEIGAVSVILWMRILQRIGEVASHAENTADILRLMLARR